ncbi:MAG: Vacuolar protein sorting-associated protein 8 [Piccolia ochrophora]|nr:MAG: Vacuolar protein sorting-associated protein 8 [Piccolia ochrophora]
MSSPPDEGELGTDDGVRDDDSSHDESESQHSGRLGSQGGEGGGETQLAELARKAEHLDNPSTRNGSALGGYGNITSDAIASANGPRELPLRAAGISMEDEQDSISNPDDTPSVQDSALSSPASSGFGPLTSASQTSPTPSLRPFDRRFQSRLSPSPLSSPRPQSPAFLNAQSRQVSLSSTVLQGQDVSDQQAPWDVVRWTKLVKVTNQAFSEAGKRSFGRATCIAVSALIILGTSKGIILVFDYHQNLKSIIGPGTQAVECGPITSLAISADNTNIAGGHANGSIMTWDLAKSARPFLILSPLEKSELVNRKVDGHLRGSPILHLSFLGTRHTALVSADDRGMSFSHLATRGLGAVGRMVKTTRILGRYPNDGAPTGRPQKPSSVLACAALPLGNLERRTDDLGLVAMLTPYLLVIVSTTPVAQTQHKAPRPKEVAAHSALSGCLAWFPSVKLKSTDSKTSESISRAKLVYCWSNVLTVLEVSEVEPSDPSEKERPPTLSFRARSRWKANEAIVAVQWLSRSVLGILTITQQLVILEDDTMRVAETLDLIHKHIHHDDVFSKQLQPIVDQLDEDVSLHGVVADAFYKSFRSYKGRIFMLGSNDVQVGTLSNWADRLLALMEEGDFIRAIQLATSYYNGDTETLMVGLPSDSGRRHALVQEKLYEMLSASLRFAFGRNQRKKAERMTDVQLEELAGACLIACISMGATEYLFDDVYESFLEGSAEGVFHESIEPYILDGQITTIPPIAVKGLIAHYTSKGLDSRLEEMICHLDTTTMDIDQLTTLCKQHNLYDAFIYVWNLALGDYITPLTELFSLIRDAHDGEYDSGDGPTRSVNGLKLFPYLSYTFTGRIYPTGGDLAPEVASKAKADLYTFLFSGKTISWPKRGGRPLLTMSRDEEEPSFPYLRLILNYDAASFLSALNEAFEDGFLNDSPERRANAGVQKGIGEDEVFGLSVNRQYIVNILLEVMSPNNFDPEDTIYLDMFIARNLPKFPQYILLPGKALQRVLVGLCNYPSKDVADDCQLSVEYLLSMYHPPDLEALIPLFAKAGFYRALKAVYKAGKDYAKLLQTYFEDEEDQEGVFGSIGDCLRPRSGLSARQVRDVRAVVEAHARDLASIDAVRTAETINNYASDLHGKMIDALQDDALLQYQYLETILEPASRTSVETKKAQSVANHDFEEQYIRLMCRFDPSHVADYVNLLQSGDLRLSEVLPTMENNGVVDAAIVLMAREGLVRDAMDRLIAHLGTLETALLGLIAIKPDSSLDDTSASETLEDVLSALQKYTHVGIWLCQGQSRSSTGITPSSTSSTLRSQLPSQIPSVVTLSSDEAGLTRTERLWLDLAFTLIRITMRATSSAPSSPTLTSLRTLTHHTFTALLTTTTSHPSSSSSTSPSRTTQPPTPVRFLPTFRALLTRLTTSSSPSQTQTQTPETPHPTPTLSSLRPLLTTIFSSYAYETSLLSLAARLLDTSLFADVRENAAQRQRGWRAGAQGCEGCGARVWGPGVGGRVWEEWVEKGGDAKRKRTGGGGGSGAEEGSVGKGKGKGRDVVLRGGGERGAGATRGEGDAVEDALPKELQPLVVFRCGHVWHRGCLDRLRGGGAGEVEGGVRCVVCK